MAKYRKKPVEIDGIQWTGKNLKEIREFCIYCNYKDEILTIITTEGDMEAHPGDYIMKGTHGEFYPVKEDIFPDTFEKVVD